MKSSNRTVWLGRFDTKDESTLVLNKSLAYRSSCEIASATATAADGGTVAVKSSSANQASTSTGGAGLASNVGYNGNDIAGEVSASSSSSSSSSSASAATVSAVAPVYGGYIERCIRLADGALIAPKYYSTLCEEDIR